MSAANALRSSVPGWGADLAPENRPASRKEANRENVLSRMTPDDYELIPRQEQKVEILVSSEHKKLTPIFGTTCPPKGLSGVFRRLAFRFSEGQKAHWLILLFADRVDVVESALGNFIRGKSHNPFKEMGLATEFRQGGFPSRFGHNRADTKRWGQQMLLAGTLIGAGVLLYRANRRNR